MKIGSDVPDQKIMELMDKQKPGMCCTLIYTSGTTGYPKGVMLSHDNLIWDATAAMADNLMIGPPEHIVPPNKHRIVSYLPLSHIAGL